MKRARESFVHRSRNLLPLRAFWDRPIPRCSKCTAPMVKVKGKWACKTHTLIDAVQVVNVVGPDGLPQPQVAVKRIPVGEMYPNRAARRRA